MDEPIGSGHTLMMRCHWEIYHTKIKSDKQGTCNYISVSTICKVLLEFFYTCHAEPYDDNSSRNQSLIAQSRVAKPDIALEPSELHIFLPDFKKNLSLRQFKQKPIIYLSVLDF